MTLKPFTEIEQGPLNQRRIFALRQDTVQSQTTGKKLVVDRLLAPDWVNVVAFDVDDNLLLVRQWRFGINEFSVEIPAGALEPGEDPIVGGLRELVEETGHEPVDMNSVVLLGATRPNAAFLNNRCYSVFVPRCAHTKPQQLDPSEEVEVLKVPRKDVDDLVRNGAARCAQKKAQTATDSLMDNSLVVVALHLYTLHQQKKT